MIKIEVTGTSIAEVSDKLLVIGASLQRTVSYEADNAAREALQAQRDAAVAAGQTVYSEDAKPTVGTEAAKRTRKAKPAEQTHAEKAASEIGDCYDKSEDKPAAEAPDRPYDFDKEVAPLVLRVVQSKGPEEIRAVLDQFGVQRASQVDPARYGELVGLLEEALS